MKVIYKLVPVIDHAATGRLVTAERRHSGVSLRKLASALKVSASFLCDLERGRRNWTQARLDETMKTLEKLDHEKTN